MTRPLDDSMHTNGVTVSTRAQYLRDHQVWNIEVLPGAFLISQLLEPNTAVSQVKLLQLHRLGDADDLLLIQDSGECSFRTAGDGEKIATMQVAAGSTDSVAPYAPTQGDVATIGGGEYYAKLEAQGNRYGKSFRLIDNIRRDTDRLVADIVFPEAIRDRGQRWTTLLDSCTHAIACLAEFDDTYLLTAIDEIVVGPDMDLDQGIHLLAEDVTVESGKARGVVKAFNKQGQCVLLVSGCELSAVAADDRMDQLPAAQNVAEVASSFTIDPMLSAGELWSRQTENFVGVKLADYGQVFQSLLSPTTGFTNGAARHVCLVRLSDLANMHSSVVSVEFGETRVPVAQHGDDQFELVQIEDGRQVASLNEYETRYLDREIFSDLSYGKHGIRLRDGDTVIDIGANIGLFSMFAHGQADNVKVFAIEPSPAVLPMLKANLQAHVENSVVVEAGASGTNGTAVFTAYKNSSVFSSFDAEAASDASAIEAIIRNMVVESGSYDDSTVDQIVEQFMQGRLESEEFTCNLVTVSHVLEQHGIERVGLLKIDAEKSEREILAGIEDRHWDLIDQVVIEVHTQSGSGAEDILDLFVSKGFDVINDEEMLLQSSGLVNLYCVRPERKKINEALPVEDKLEDVVGMLTEAVKTRATRSSVPLDVVLCPSRHSVDRYENLLVGNLDSISNVRVVSWSDYAVDYTADSIFDDVSDGLGHIPYTQSWYAATTSQVIRNTMLAAMPRHKVIAVDCDNTLWGGVVGEAGVEGITIDDGHRALHQYLNEAVEKGLLLCLLSKNNENDVREVFDKRSDLSVDWNSVSACRINWSNKSENISAIALELNLGLDSFVFLDDSGMECEEMRARHPEVLTLQVPENPALLGEFIEAVPLNLGSSDVLTEEDKKRSQMYQQERARGEARGSYSSLRAFLETLNLNVDIKPVASEDVARAAQMTQRTNQFNSTTTRFSEADIATAIDTGAHVHILRVSDKFGDYGQTGLVIFKVIEDQLVVSSLLLSCRVLGRGVEYELLRHLASQAQGAGASDIVIHYNPTAKNEPVRAFLAGLGMSADGSELRLSADNAAAIEFDPDKDAESVDDSGQQTIAPVRFAVSSGSVENMALHLNTTEKIISRLQQAAVRTRPDIGTAYIEPENDLEITLSDIWRQLLKLDRVGINDNFFDLGGTSLLGVQMVAELSERLGKRISVVQLFDSRTISEMVKILSGDTSDREEAADGRSKGAERRQRRARRGRK